MKEDKDSGEVGEKRKSAERKIPISNFRKRRRTIQRQKCKSLQEKSEDKSEKCAEKLVSIMDERAKNFVLENADPSDGWTPGPKIVDEGTSMDRWHPSRRKKSGRRCHESAA